MCESSDLLKKACSEGYTLIALTSGTLDNIPIMMAVPNAFQSADPVVKGVSRKKLSIASARGYESMLVREVSRFLERNLQHPR